MWLRKFFVVIFVTVNNIVYWHKILLSGQKY